MFCFIEPMESSRFCQFHRDGRLSISTSLLCVCLRYPQVLALPLPRWCPNGGRGKLAVCTKPLVEAFFERPTDRMRTLLIELEGSREYVIVSMRNKRCACVYLWSSQTTVELSSSNEEGDLLRVSCIQSKILLSIVF